MTSPASSAEGRFGALLRLVRFPLVPTAVADSAAGFLIAVPRGSLEQTETMLTLAALAGVSACLYMSGMVFNDYFDQDRDRALHPSRPIPSGAVAPERSALLGMILAGLAFGFAVPLPMEAQAVGILLLVAIMAYDILLKRWGVPGALMMGACRALNLSLGILAAFWLTFDIDWTGGHRPFLSSGNFVLPLSSYGSFFMNHPPCWIAPLLLGAYVAAIALISTREEEHPGAAKWVAILLLGIIPLDAAMVAGSGRPLAALGVLALLPLALGLRRLLPRHE